MRKDDPRPPTEGPLAVNEQGDTQRARLLMNEGRGLVDELDEQRALASVSEGLLGRPSTAARVGRFVLLDRVGSGGMGVVYSAFDPQLDRKVAIKLLHPSDSDTPDESRLLTEARSLARLSHPNVVTIHEVGVYDGRTFLAMELVQGESLAVWLATPRAWRDVASVMASAGDGLAAAHEAGIVHRDVKPSNVILGEDGRVTVLDFGLARADLESRVSQQSDPDADVSGAITRPGSVLGTPAYMAPEQHRGEVASPASDQFSLCVSLYEGLYGQLPFAMVTRTQIRDDIEAGRFAPVPGSHHVPAWLRRVVLRGLSPEAADRWPSMAGLVEALRRGLDIRLRRLAIPAAIVGGAGLIAWSLMPAPLPPCEELVNASVAAVWNADVRERISAALGAIEHPAAATMPPRVVAAIDSFSTNWSAARVAVCEGQRAEVPPDGAEQTAACLDGKLQGLATAVDLLGAPDATVLTDAQRIVPHESDIDGCLAPIVAEGPRPPDLSRIRGEVEASLSRAAVLGRSGKHDEAAELVNEALAIAEASGDVGLSARAQRMLGSLRYSTGDDAEALKLGQAALVDAERAGDTVARLDAQRAVARVLIKTSRLDEAEHLLALTEAAHARFEPRPWAWDAELEEILAELALEQGDPERAAKHAANLLAIVQEHAEHEAHRVLTARALVAQIAGALRDNDGALEQWNWVLEEGRSLYGPVHDYAATAHSAIGIIHFNRGKVDEAIASMRTGLGLREQLNGPEHPAILNDLINLGTVLAPKDASGAEALYVRGVAIARADGKASERYLATLLGRLAGIADGEKRYEDASAYARESWEMQRKINGETHPRAIGALCNYGESLVRFKRYEEALKLFEQALRLDVMKRGADSKNLLPTLHGLAKSLESLERYDDALAHLENAARLIVLHKEKGRLPLSILNKAIKLQLRRGGKTAVDAAAKHLATADPLLEDQRVPAPFRVMLDQRREDIRLARGGETAE